MLLTILSIICFTRTHHASKLQKLYTIYFKGCGLAGKAFDTLHALGITMSSTASYEMTERLSKAARMALLSAIEHLPWLFSYDNLNIAFRTYEQRLNKKSHFDI